MGESSSILISSVGFYFGESGLLTISYTLGSDPDEEDFFIFFTFFSFFSFFTFSLTTLSFMIVSLMISLTITVSLTMITC